MRKFYLTTSFQDKDEVKSLGARWDGGNRKWYWTGEGDLPEGLAKFNPSEVKKAADILVMASVNDCEWHECHSWNETFKFVYKEIDKAIENNESDDDLSFSWKLKHDNRYLERIDGLIMFDALCEDSRAMRMFFDCDSRAQ